MPSGLIDWVEWTWSYEKALTKHIMPGQFIFYSDRLVMFLASTDVKIGCKNRFILKVFFRFIPQFFKNLRVNRLIVLTPIYHVTSFSAGLLPVLFPVVTTSAPFFTMVPSPFFKAISSRESDGKLWFICLPKFRAGPAPKGFLLCQI